MTSNDLNQTTLTPTHSNKTGLGLISPIGQGPRLPAHETPSIHACLYACIHLFVMFFTPQPLSIVYTHGVRMGWWAAVKSLSMLYLRNRKV